MPPEVESSQPTLEQTVESIAAAMLRLDPGDLARLRRMRIDGPGELPFWSLAVRSGLRADEKGLALVRIMALLAPKGDPGQRQPFHSFERMHALGAALARTGYSELRLARFLETPFQARMEALERMARWLAGKNAIPVNCFDIASLLFFSDVSHTRRLARDYYQKLDYSQTEDASK